MFKPMSKAAMSLVAATVAVVLAVLPGAANAHGPFSELRGVPEQLGMHKWAMDSDWLWSALLLLAVIVSLWAFHRRDRRK